MIHVLGLFYLEPLQISKKFVLYILILVSLHHNNQYMNLQDFKNELQQVASEMKLTKNIFTAATKEQLEIAANSCTVETYIWETSEASFLMKDGVKGVRLFDNGEAIDLLSNGLEAESLYEDFKANGIKC
jgi:hypothetical protein